MHLNHIREALRRQPFVPFALRLADGRAFPVQHPEFVAVSRRLVVVVGSKDDSMTVLDPLLITSVDYPDGRGIALPASRGGGDEESPE